MRSGCEHFRFSVQTIFFYISISGVRSGERKLSAVLYAVPKNKRRSFSFFGQKMFCRYLNFWGSYW